MIYNVSTLYSKKICASYRENHVAYRTLKDVKFLIKDNEELPFTISPIRLLMKMYNLSVSRICLPYQLSMELGAKEEILTSLSIWLDWTNLMVLGLQKNFLGTSYKLINFSS
jgi:hypothetical protein